MDTPNQVLTSILIGNNTVNIMIVLVSHHVMEAFTFSGSGTLYQQVIGILIEMLLITSVILLLGEILPKSFALRHAHSLVKLLVTPFFVFHNVIGVLKLRSVITGFVFKLNQIVHRVFGEKEESVNYEDIKLAVEMGLKEGHFSQDEADMVEKVLNFTRFPLNEMMTTRSQVKTVSPNNTIAEAIEIAEQKEDALLPVYDSQNDVIVGVFAVAPNFLRDKGDLVKRVMTAPHFVPIVSASEGILSALEDNEEELLIMVDEFGSYQGVVLIESVLEYIVEKKAKKEETPPLRSSFLNSSKNGIVIEGEEKIEVVEEILGFSFPKGEYQTFAGYIIAHIGEIPKEKLWVVVEGRKFYIEEANPNRIVKVFVPKKG